ncbi:hypothetical protein CKO12_10920 [Chromatium okenii]|uniref:hypothetical protein n=1 Tax=Chromatium okenii TaxID=61644 RepID=UPI001908FFD4|nr:hypothetical protein [Chromatium okenii]MBK1642380.1 hypothetical protein [Chromatium okenii]
MHKIALAVLFSLAGVLMALPAQADSIRDRLEHQRAVIERGIDNGSITRREAKELHSEQRDIRQLAEELRDAGASRSERRRVLESRLDRIDRRLRKALRDRDDRPRRDDRYRPDAGERPHQFLDRDQPAPRLWER